MIQNQLYQERLQYRAQYQRELGGSGNPDNYTQHHIEAPSHNRLVTHSQLALADIPCSPTQTTAEMAI